VRDLIRASLALMALALFCLPGVAEAAKPKPKPKPHLVVSDLTFKSSPAQSTSTDFPFVVLESDRTGRFGLVFTVKNIGKARAPKSGAQILVVDNYFRTERLHSIAPGKSETLRVKYNQRFKAPGFSNVSVCVGDDDECTKPVEFAVLVRTWRVILWTTGPSSLTGIAPFFASRADGLSFDFYGPVSEKGNIYYTWLATGGISGDTTGSDGVCSYSGHGAASHSPWDVIDPNVGYLEMTPQLDGYFAEVNEKGYSFTTTQRCPGYPDNDTQGPISPLETIGIDGRVDQTMTPDATGLGGAYNIPTDIASGSSVGEWSFRADVP
jgi:hypothetical protein